MGKNRESLQTADSLEEVIEQYAQMVYRLAFAQTRNKADADDVFQDVFLRYIKKHGQLEGGEHRKAWLIRVTINCSRQLWRSPWKKRTVSLEENDLVFDQPEENYLHIQLCELPEKYRSVIHLFYYEDMSVSQISEALKRKPSTVRTQLTRARTMLRELLKEDFDV